MKGKIKYILLGIVILLFAFTTFPKLMPASTKPVKSEDEMYAAINRAVMRYDNSITVECEESYDIDYGRILNNALESNVYVGSELYGIVYTEIPTDDGYKQKINIKKLSRFKSFCTKRRAKKIAKDVAGLSDYDKVKAVHDYIILSSDYGIAEAGAFDMLFFHQASCNGYTFAFYEIMHELGIPVTVEYGDAHVWNKVKIGEYWYNIDLTWDDQMDDRIVYDYFLKCDADFGGHHHAGADAPKSLETTGRTAQENFALFRNYNGILIAKIVILIVLLFVALTFGNWFMLKYKKAQLDKRRKMEEEAARMNREWNMDESDEPDTPISDSPDPKPEPTANEQTESIPATGGFKLKM